MASGEDNDKNKDFFDPKDPDKKSDKKDEATSPGNATGKKTKNEDNPFSFKKFLQASEGQNGVKGNCMKVVNHDLAKDLPDFVQGHTSHTENTRSPSNLPDFTFCTSRNNSINNAHNHHSTSFPPIPALQPPDDVNLSLPDFLSGSIGMPLLKNDSIDENEHNLQLQNSILWQKIEQLNAAFLAEKQRNETLSTQLSAVTREKGHSSLQDPSPSTSNSLPNDIVQTNNQESQQITESVARGEGGCGRCEEMAGHIRTASQQLNSLVQAANHFSRVLSEGSENLNQISRMLNSAPSSSQPDQNTVQPENK